LRTFKAKRPSGKVGRVPGKAEGNAMKGRGQCYETYCDFSKSSYHQQADGKNTPYRGFSPNLPACGQGRSKTSTTT